MSFSDMDAVEEMIGKSVDRMTDSELVTYVKTYMQAVYDLNLPVSGVEERSIMACLKRIYGSDAGKIVKWTTWRYDGKPNGKPITYSTFSKGMKWRTDLWYLELQEHLKSEKSRTESPASQGFLSLRDI